MNTVIIKKLASLQEVQVCDSMFREYMHWLIQELYAAHAIIITPDQEERLHTDFREEWPSLIGERGGIYLATLDEIPLGVCTLKPISETEVELKRFYVKPGNRGRGIGRQLIDLVLTETINMGYQIVRLETFAFMETALKLYKLHGFEQVNAFEGYEGASHGTGGVELFMIKRNY